MCFLIGLTCSVNALENSIRMDPIRYCSPCRGSIVPSSVRSNSFLYNSLLGRPMTYRRHRVCVNWGYTERWKHWDGSIEVLNFDVPVCGRIAILTNQSSAVSLCTSQFKYPLKYSIPRLRGRAKSTPKKVSPGVVSIRSATAVPCFPVPDERHDIEYWRNTRSWRNMYR